MKRSPETHPTLEKRRQPGRIRAFILAVSVHAVFFALIVFGITWQSSPTAPIVAEIWDKLPPIKSTPPAPEPEPPKPPPEPPKPEVKPEPPRPDPAIAEKVEREKAKRERLEKEREEKRKQDDARKKREQEEEKRRKADERAKREAAEKTRAEAQSAKQAEVNRYVDAIKAKIRGKANVPDTVTGNPEVHVRLRMLPGGEVLEATVTQSSGNRAYDTAIERAIRSAQPLPVPPADSELFPQFRDLILNIRHER